MGVVFKARDPVIGRLVALKTIAVAASQSEDLRERFYREAQAAGGLQHPNIVTIFEMGEAEEIPYIAMEYLEGESLDLILARRLNLPLALKLGYLVQVCRALAHAHKHGIVHRDIKPGNIVVTRDATVKVVDFGIARMVDTSKTQTGVLLGTLAYMSPQLLRGERADERSDIWAVGVVCYELLAGERPFNGENHAALLLKIVSDEPRPLENLTGDCPAELCAAVSKMLQKDAAKRFQTFEEVLQIFEPLWRKYQRECVDGMLEKCQSLVREGELSDARGILLQACLIDGTRTLTRQMLDQVNASLKDKLLPAEVEAHLDRARNLRSEGLIEEARAAAKAAVDLDASSEPARLLLAQLEQEARSIQQEKEHLRASAIQRLLTAMRVAMEQGDPGTAVRLARESLGRVGHDTRIRELAELAERKLRQGQSGAAHGGSGSGASGPAELQLEVSPDAGQDLLREYVFEHASMAGEQGQTSTPSATAHAVNAPRPGRTRTATQLNLDRTDKTGQRSGTLVLPQASSSTARLQLRWSKRPVVMAVVTAVLAGALLAAISWRRILQTRRDLPAAPAELPAKQVSLEEQQRTLIAQAHEAADRNDYATAQSKLQDASKLGGPLGPRIEELQNRFRQEEQNADIRGIAAQERDLWTKGTGLLSEHRLAEAENVFQQILALPPGGRRRTDAQRMLEETIPKEKESERLFSEGQQLSRSNDAENLRHAQQLLDRVIVGSEPRRTEAEKLRASVLEHLNKQKEDERQSTQATSLTAAARQAVDRGDWAAARGALAEMRQHGINIDNLSAEIARAEQAHFAGLEAQYKENAARADEAARQHLSGLQRQFRSLAAGGGPLAEGARNYAERLIPARLSDMSANAAAASTAASENQAFDSAVSDYKRFLEAHDANSLKNVALPKFQAIAQAGGTRAADAGQYVTTIIPVAMRQLTPYPPIGCTGMASGLGPAVKAGELVACGLLDKPGLKWVQFAWPEFPARARQVGQARGTAMLTLTVDENGSVVDARPRGRSDTFGFSDAAIEAARSWKTNPPRAQSKPVRTQFSVDLTFSQ
jgi:TonB family protein